MNERGRWLAAGIATVLLTGCSSNNQENLKCPNTSAEVADRIGGHPDNWRIVRGSALWEYEGPARIFARQYVGRLLVNDHDGVLKVLLAEQEARAEKALYRCNNYDELNPPEPYRKSLEVTP